MQLRVRLLIAIVLSLSVTSMTARAESLEAIKKKIHDQTSRLKSLSYKAHSNSVVQTPDMTVKTDSDQTVQFMRQGDKVLTRMEVSSTSMQKFGGKEEKILSNMLTISDGIYQYTYSESAGQKSAFRQKVDSNNQINVFDGNKLFSDMEQNYSLKVLPDETVDGRSCFVLEMTPKAQMAAAGMGKTISHFDKSDGIIRKSVTNDKDGKLMNSMTTSDVKVDDAIPADRFKFKAPEGVTVQDMPS